MIPNPDNGPEHPDCTSSEAGSLARLQSHEPLPRLAGRIVLRRLHPEDLDVFQSYRRDPETGRHQGWSPMTDNEARAFLSAMNSAALFAPGKWFQLGIAEPGTFRLMGDIGIRIDATEAWADIGFTLNAQSRGRGLATEAVLAAMQLVFEHTAVREIVGVADSRNHRSLRLLERLGMRRIKSERTVFRGEPCVEFTFVLPRPDLDGGVRKAGERKGE